MVTADIPGVTPDHLDVRVDHNVLTIRAQADHTSADVGE
ncbi:MAG TPA: Hsp20/alpha crystallin family protein [Candidatus Entotheonella sp.]